MIVSCRRSGPVARPAAAGDAASPRAAGRSALTARSRVLRHVGVGRHLARRPDRLRRRGPRNLLDGRRSARRLRAAQLGDERLGCRIGLRVQLALEQRNEVLVVLERFGLASRGGQRLYDQPMGILAHVVERDGALAGLQSVLGAAGGQLLFAEPHQGAKGELQQPLALTRQPFAPALFADGNVVDELARGRDRLPHSRHHGCPRESGPRTG